jgi:hypothetical protein
MGSYNHFFILRSPVKINFFPFAFLSKSPPLAPAFSQQIPEILLGANLTIPVNYTSITFGVYGGQNLAFFKFFAAITAGLPFFAGCYDSPMNHHRLYFPLIKE